MSLPNATPAAAFLALATACVAPAPPPPVEGEDDSPESTPTPYETGVWPDRLIHKGSFFACAVNAEGDIVCWGRDPLGTTQPPEGPWKGISGDGTRYCGVRQNGEGECWDFEGGGFIPPGPSGVAVQVELDYDGHTCWLLADGLLDCYSAPDEVFPRNAEWAASLDGEGPFIDIGLSRFGLIGVRPGGDFTLFYGPWGHTPQEQDTRHPQWGAGLAEASGVYGLTLSGEIDYWNDISEHWTIEGGDYTHLFTNGSSACGMHADRSVTCFAPPPDFSEPCGEDDVDKPPCVECYVPPGPWIDIAYSCPTGCGIRPDWSIECWGCDQPGPWFGTDMCDPPQFPFKWQPTRQLLDSSLGQ